MTNRDYTKNYRVKDISGENFNRLSVIDFAYSENGMAFWNCICSCGNSAVMSGVRIRNNKTKSCGCLSKETRIIIGKCNKIHGKSKSPEYISWADIKSRCYNKKDKGFENYGDRGIVMCDEWLNSFSQFYADMGNRPSKKHTIDRINNNGNYDSKNCKWSTKKEQARNRRTSKLFTINGETKSLAEWAEISGINYQTIFQRITTLNWTIEKSLNTPVWGG